MKHKVDAVVNIDNSEIVFPLMEIKDEDYWNKINSIILKEKAISQFYFIKDDSVKVWPEPPENCRIEIYHNANRS